MKSLRHFKSPILASIILAAVLPTPAPAAIHVLRSPPLVAIAQTLPAAKSGQSYLWRLKPEGGKSPYRCLPQKLGVGTIALTAACTITGIAPVVQIMSITGPFRFKVQDSSSPKKTAEFPSMNFTVLGAPISAPPPPVPSGFTLVASAVGNDANGGLVYPDIPTVDNPLNVDVRVTGGSMVTTSASLICDTGTDFVDVDRTFNGDGLFVLPVQTGALSCDIAVTSSGNGSFVVQIYVKTGASPTPNSTPTPDSTPTKSPPTQSNQTKYPFDGIWTGTITGTYSAFFTTEIKSPPPFQNTTEPVNIPVRAVVREGWVGPFSGKAQHVGYEEHVYVGGVDPASPNFSSIDPNGSDSTMTINDLTVGGSITGIGGFFVSCPFSMNFTTSGTAISSIISCSYTDDMFTYLARSDFSGTFNLTRTSVTVP